MDKMSQLLNRCKCGVFLSMNEHRNFYQSAAEAIADMDARECPPEISQEVREQMIATNTIIEVQFYPRTPIGFYLVVHYDLEEALDEALACMEVNCGVLNQ